MATEKRLIDAFDAMRNALYLEGILAVPTFCIENIPTVDAVEVVRCKDCDYNLRDDDRIPRCTYWHEDVSVNGFCHHGKMREEEDDDEDDEDD